jgi:aspartate kinase
MKTVIMKFGGSSLSTEQKIKKVAQILVNKRKSGDKVVAVVSAQGKTTNDLLQMAKSISKNPHKRELDMLLTVGERVSMALLSMVISDMGYESISLTGSQCGIITNDQHYNAKIIDVRPFRVMDELEKGKIVIVAGFQGVSYKREITSLGRGGSDTTAVALSAALDAEFCEIYSDVDGVYSGDPRIVDPFRLVELSYDEMMELSYRGAKVLNYHSIEFAKKNGIAIYARATSGGGETIVRKNVSTKYSTPLSITGLNHLHSISLKHGQITEILDFLQKYEINIHYYFSNHENSILILKNLSETEIQLLEKYSSKQCSSISLIGKSINYHPELLRKSLEIFKEKNIEVITCEISSLQTTFFIENNNVNLIKVFHNKFIKKP